MRGKKKRVRAESSLVADIANKARKELSEYLIANKLDPMLDWDDHPIHGFVTKRLNKIILFNEQKAKIMAKKEKDEKKKLKKPEILPKKVREKPTKQPRVYEYPKVDGRDMTSDEKKKYRQKMRVLMKSEMPLKEATEKALAFAKRSVQEAKPKEDKKEKKVKEEKKEATKKVAKKEEKTKKIKEVEEKPKNVVKKKREED